MLFHKKFAFPPEIKSKFPSAKRTLVYSRHSKDELINDEFNKGQKIELPRELGPNSEIIECEVFSGKISKAVWKMPLTSSLDIFLVLVYDIGNTKAFVKTLWLYPKDQNKRVNPNKYANKK